MAYSVIESITVPVIIELKRFPIMESHFFHSTSRDLDEAWVATDKDIFVATKLIKSEHCQKFYEKIQNIQNNHQEND